MSKLKVKVSAKDGKAQDLLQALQNLPSKAEVRASRIPNYVSDDSLFIPAGANSSKQKGSERLPDSTQDPRPGEARQNRSEAEYKAHSFPSASVNSVDDATSAITVKPTAAGGNYSKLPPNHPEHTRQANNRARDARCNHGRGKNSLPVVN